jgi:DUF438 domain-containing protein
MSEFTNNNRLKTERLTELARVVISKEKVADHVKSNMDLLENVTPPDVVTLVHNLVEDGYDMEELKKHVAKLLNLFYKAINNTDPPAPPKGSLIYYLQENAREMSRKLDELKQPIRDLNKTGVTGELKQHLAEGFERLQVYNNHFVIKENLLFPVIEKHWDDYKCVLVMWSIHDDIRRYLKELPVILRADDFDLHEFNVVSSKLYFDFKAIKFRDEKILFPQVMLTIPDEVMESLTDQSRDFDFPFVKPARKKMRTNEYGITSGGSVNLGTGAMTPEQIALIFNHLPVDLTYVDENDKVVFYSTPKRRIFPRTNAVLGREVQNCHPPESVHIVEKIVDAFRKGDKDEASFWIQMRGEFILIRYYAVRDKDGRYRGTLEVSQEVTDIRKLEGENRLLDWDS